MTAVEWFFRWVNDNSEATYKEYAEAFEQAKEMEKQQIIDAFDEGQEYEYQYHINNAPKFDSQTYFTETYGSKGSDATSSQTEISDEEIEKAWDSYQRECLEKFMKDSTIACYAITNKETFAKWYREKLKSKH